MNIKDFLKMQMKDFFVITTFVNIAMFILGSTYNKGMTFSYEVLLMPPLYGFFGVLPSWFLYSKKEVSMKNLFVRKIFQFVTLEILLIALTFYGQDVRVEDISVVISFAVSVFVIYILVGIVSWIVDTKDAKMMMESLLEYQKINEIVE